jgi:hypothetical protein
MDGGPSYLFFQGKSEEKAKLLKQFIQEILVNPMIDNCTDSHSIKVKESSVENPTRNRWAASCPAPTCDRWGANKYMLAAQESCTRPLLSAGVLPVAQPRA